MLQRTREHTLRPRPLIAVMSVVGVIFDLAIQTCEARGWMLCHVHGHAHVHVHIYIYTPIAMVMVMVMAMAMAMHMRMCM